MYIKTTNYSIYCIDTTKNVIEAIMYVIDYSLLDNSTFSYFKLTS